MYCRELTSDEVLHLLIEPVLATLPEELKKKAITGKMKLEFNSEYGLEVSIEERLKVV